MKLSSNAQITLVLLTIAIMFFGTFWVLSLSNPTITFNFEMDQNTLEYLTLHDYCMYTIQPGYDSDESTYIFMGDCEYMNQTVMVK